MKQTYPFRRNHICRKCRDEFRITEYEFGYEPTYCECGEPVAEARLGTFVPYMSYQLSKDPHNPVEVRSPEHKKQLMKDMGLQEWSPGIKWKEHRKEVSIKDKLDEVWEKAKSKVRRK